MYFNSPYINLSQSVASIDNLLDVSLTTLSNDEILVYNSSTGKWENQPLTSASGGTVTEVGLVLSDGIIGSVADSTTTPSIFLSLGNITPDSISSPGTIIGSNISGTNTGDQTITLTGDVIGSGTGTFSTTITNNAVTYAKLQDASGGSLLLGRGDTGTGDYEEITLGAGLSITGTVLSAVGASYSQVNTYNDLPITIGSPSVGTIFVVINSTGVWLINRKESGLYRRVADTGALTDWERLGNWNEIAKDTNFQLVNTLDNTKLGRFDLSAISTGQSRTLAFPDKSGTIALLDDIPGDQTITLTGDVTGSGTGTFSTTITDNAVTYAKLQDASTNNILLGRATTGAGDYEEITLGTGLELSGTTLNATVSDSSVISVIAGEDLTSFKTVRLSNNQAFLYDFTNDNQFGECVGITISGATLGNTINIKLFGKQTVAQTLVDGSEYFAGTGGVLTDNPPITGTIQKIGIAVSTSDLFINLGSPTLLA